MVKSVVMAKELVIVLENKSGILADISAKLAERDINIEAVAGYNLPDNTAKLMLMTSDNLRAITVLEASGHKPVRESDVVLVELDNKIGALKEITGKLAANKIDIRNMYATTCHTGCSTRLIFTTTDNLKTIALLKK